MRVILFCIFITLFVAGAQAQVPNPKILPPNEVPFNWPPARQVGEADYFRIVEDGKPLCSIVLPSKPSDQEEKSARLLQMYLRFITGAEVEIKREPAGGPGIYIGDTEVGKRLELGLPPLKYPSGITLPNLHGYLVTTVDPNTMVIRGITDFGTSFGVVGLLRDFMGVRRYWPGEPGGIGDVYFRRSSLSIPKLTWRDWPYMISRATVLNPKGWEYNNGTAWPTMTKMNRVASTIGIVHNLQVLILPSEYGKEHPEYFPMMNGKRFVPPTDTMPHWQPCVSNPEVIQICADKIIQSFDRNPLSISSALAVNDGAGDCECDGCRAWDIPETDINSRTQTSDRYAKFMNAVAEKVAAKHPDRLLGFLIYGPLRDVPKTVKLHPNLVGYTAAMGRGVYHQWDEWMAAGLKNMGHWGYHIDPWFVIPKINPHQEARRIRYMVGSLTGIGYFKEFNPTYPLTGHAVEVFSNLMWDPRLNEDAILTKYYGDMFAEAAWPMQAFYETLENDYEAWQKANAPEHPYGPDMSDLHASKAYGHLAVLTEEGSVKAWEHLLRAESVARDPKVKERIALVKDIYGMVLPCVREYWRVQELPKVTDADKAARLAREALQAAAEKADYKARVIESPRIKPWTLYTRAYYDSIQQGVVPPEVLTAIDESFTAIRHAKPGDLSAFERLAKDPNEVIAQAAKTQIELAKSDPKGWDNLVEDPGFEDGKMPELFDVEKKKGTLTIVDQAPHGGKKCAVFTDCRDTAMIKPFAAEPGEKFLVSVWLRAANASAIYSLGVQPVTGKGQAAGITKQLEFSSEDWQEFKFLYTAPPGTTRGEVRIKAMRQHAKAKLWVDDISVVRIPVKPLTSDQAPTGMKTEEDPPEE